MVAPPARADAVEAPSEAQRLNRVWNGLLDAIRHMQVSADELRRLTRRNHVPEYVEYLRKNRL